MHSRNNLNCIPELNKKLGLFLKENRLNADLTGKELGRIMHISQQQVSRYEMGVCSLTIAQLSRYLTVFDISWQDFVHDVMGADKWGEVFNHSFNKDDN